MHQNDAKGWSVIYTRPNHERSVQKQLDMLKIENFLPIANTFVLCSYKKKCVNRVLFPSYIFAKPGGVRQYFDSLSIPGVLYYLKTASQIAHVSESVIDSIKLLNKENIIDYVEITGKKIAKGEVLNIKKGPFKGIACEVVQYKNNFKIVVRIDLLQRSVLVDVNSDCLTY